MGESILSVPIFLSNFYFNNSIDYFNNETANIPLLHTWSLSIEWQFYWVFPFLFLAVYKSAKKQTLTLLYIFVIASILFVQLGGNLNFSEPYIDKNFRLFNQPTFINYYSPIGRAWEFVFGSIAALHIVKKGTLSGSIGNAFSLLGLAMIIITAVVFDSATIFPSIYTVFPVLGATLIILGGSNDNFISKLLSHKTLSSVGLASYSIYLWHLPIFVFVRQYGFKLNDPLVFAPVTGAIGLLSYFSWKYIETPFRNPIKIPNSNFLTHTAIITSFLFALGGTYIYTKGFIDFYTPRDRILLKSRTASARYVTKRFNERSTANFSESDTLKVALIGDSYAQDFLNIITEGGVLNNAEIITRYISGTCQIVYSYNQTFITDGKLPNGCFPKNGKTLLENILPSIKRADVVIFASSWQNWAIKELPETISKLNLTNRQKLFLVGSKIFGAVNVRKTLKMNDAERENTRKKMAPHFIKINQTLEEIAETGYFINIMESVCDEKYRCRRFTPNHYLISYDGGHLTKEGATYISNLITNRALLDLGNSD